MVTCSECDARNSLDSKFCKSCGHALNSAEVEAARKDLEAQFIQARDLYAAKDYSACADVLQHVLHVDPGHSGAWALKGDLKLVGEHHPVEAIECYKQALELDPDSALLPLKVEHAEGLIAVDEVRNDAAPRPRKNFAVMAGVASAMLVACVGSAIALSLNGTDALPTKQTSVDGAMTAANKPASDPMPVGGIGLDANGNPLAPEVSREEYNRVQRQASENANPAPTRRTEPEFPEPARNGRSERIGNDDREVAPVRVSLEDLPADPDASRPQRNPDPAPNPRPSNTVDPDPKPEGDKKPDRPQAVVDVRPSTNRPNQGGSQSVPDKPNTANSAADWLRKGREAMLAGDYAKASEAFEKALSLGAAVGPTNQRLAQAYQRQGRTADAIRAYRAAIASFEASGSNPSALEACKTALAALGG